MACLRAFSNARTLKLKIRVTASTISESIITLERGRSSRRRLKILNTFLEIIKKISVFKIYSDLCVFQILFQNVSLMKIVGIVITKNLNLNKILYCKHLIYIKKNLKKSGKSTKYI